MSVWLASALIYSIIHGYAQSKLYGVIPVACENMLQWVANVHWPFVALKVFSLKKGLYEYVF